METWESRCGLSKLFIQFRSFAVSGIVTFVLLFALSALCNYCFIACAIYSVALRFHSTSDYCASIQFELFDINKTFDKSHNLRFIQFTFYSVRMKYAKCISMTSSISTKFEINCSKTKQHKMRWHISAGINFFIFVFNCFMQMQLHICT